MKRTFPVTAAALLLATHLGTPAAAYFKADQLLEIENILPDNGWAALRLYVIVHPGLPEDTGVIAKLCPGISRGIATAAGL